MFPIPRQKIFRKQYLDIRNVQMQDDIISSFRNEEFHIVKIRTRVGSEFQSRNRITEIFPGTLEAILAVWILFLRMNP